MAERVPMDGGLPAAGRTADRAWSVMAKNGRRAWPMLRIRSWDGTSPGAPSEPALPILSIGTTFEGDATAANKVRRWNPNRPVLSMVTTSTQVSTSENREHQSNPHRQNLSIGTSSDRGATAENKVRRWNPHRPVLSIGTTSDGGTTAENREHQSNPHRQNLSIGTTSDGGTTAENKVRRWNPHRPVLSIGTPSDRGTTAENKVRRLDPRTSILCLFLTTLPLGAAAQDMDARVRSAIGAATGMSGIFSDTKKADVLAPYDGVRADEQDIAPAALEGEGMLRSLGTSREAGVYGGIGARVPMSIDPDDPLLDDAKWAATLGADVLGDIMDGTARSCTYRDFGEIPPFEQTCEVFPNFEEPSCTARLVPGADGDSEDLSDCAAILSNPECIPASRRCVETAATRIVDGTEYSRLCWAWRDEYICPAPGEISTCAPFETNPACAATASSCLVTADDGSCSHEEVTYTCGDPDAALDPACGAVQVCQGTVCEGVAVEPDTDFANAAANLALAQEAVGGVLFNDLTCSGDADGVGCISGSLRFFDGTRNTCDDSGVIIDCCENDGIFRDLLGGCNATEIRIATSASNGTLHPLGDYCSKRVLGICLQRSYSFCVYDTRLARIFNEEVRRVTGAGWDGARSEDCRGLSLAEMGSVDLGSIDLSEVFEEMIAGGEINDRDALEARLEARIFDILAATGPGDAGDGTITDATDAPSATLGEIAAATASDPYVETGPAATGVVTVGEDTVVIAPVAPILPVCAPEDFLCTLLLETGALEPVLPDPVDMPVGGTVTLPGGG